jgi:hypothetical protein
MLATSARADTIFESDDDGSSWRRGPDALFNPSHTRYIGTAAGGHTTLRWRNLPTVKRDSVVKLFCQV